ncbi:MAG: hypothetical protein WBN14_11660 [Polyangiales bacterium]
MMRTLSILTGFLLAAAIGTACKKTNGSPSSATAASAGLGLNCDHELSSSALAKHSWPYPADYRNLRWGDRYQKVRLKLKPTSAAFVTATVTWKSGELIEVEDSEVRIIKPRRLIAKRDLYVKRKVWDQGIQLEREFVAVAQGEVGSFLFYNSRGMCMVGTEEGPAWTPCTLDDAFEGLSEEQPQACEQVWWVKVRKSKVDRGWMPVVPGLTERVPPPSGAAK